MYSLQIVNIFDFLQDLFFYPRQLARCLCFYNTDLHTTNEAVCNSAVL